MSEAADGFLFELFINAAPHFTSRKCHLSGSEAIAYSQKHKFGNKHNIMMLIFELENIFDTKNS